MIGRAFCASLALASSSATQSDVPAQTYPLVHQVICAEGKGTAFRVGPHTFLSVAHVANLTACTIGGIRFTATSDNEKDFAILDYPVEKLGGFKINCDGFIPGDYYYAIGYAGGRPYQTIVTVTATYVKGWKRMQLLLGYPTFIPGMSGGPVLNARGEVVGTVNAFNRGFPFSWSRALRDTSICSNA